MITNDNYEGYLMRYADGELNKEDSADVEAFLAQHPELGEELLTVKDPRFRVTPPDAAMPDKERLLHKEAAILTSGLRWLSVAAMITFFILAAGIARHLFLNDVPPVMVAGNNNSPSTPASDTLKTRPSPTLTRNNDSPAVLNKTILAEKDTPAVNTTCDTAASNHETFPPDSLYINPARREPVFLAQHIDQIPATVEETTTDDNMAVNGIRMIANRMIIIDNAELTEMEPSLTTSNPEVQPCYVVEYTRLSETPEQTLLGKAITAIASMLQRGQKTDNSYLASTE